MSFWTESSLEPKRNFRFKIVKEGWDNDSTWWWAKSADIPGFNINNSEYQLINHKFKYPGILSWNAIQIEVVGFFGGGPSTAVSLESELSKIGYTRPDNAAMDGISKTSKSVVADLVLQQLDAAGIAQDTWTLRGAFISSVSHSKLDYSSDEISTTIIEIDYDYVDYG